MRVDPEIYRWLESLPTLAEGQTADLKVATALVSIWLVRTGVADGEATNREVQIELNDHGVWVAAEEFPNKRFVRQLAAEAARVAGYAGGGKF